MTIFRRCLCWSDPSYRPYPEAQLTLVEDTWTIEVVPRLRATSRHRPHA